MDLWINVPELLQSVQNWQIVIWCLQLVEWVFTHPILASVLLFIEYVILMEASVYVVGKPWEKFFLPVKVFFLVQDWAVNVLLSVVFIDPPRSWLEVVTGRMKRYQTEVYRENYWIKPIPNRLLKWRYLCAVWLCRHLNRYDPSGQHC